MKALCLLNAAALRKIASALFVIIVAAALAPSRVTAQSERALGLSSKPVKALPLNSKRYAVVIGVDEWKQSGNNIQIVIGNSYSVLHGTLDGNVMKGEGTNQEGVTWKWTLFKKE